MSNNNSDKRMISVVDEVGEKAIPTYLRRAKGLVKHGRAEWLDDHSIQINEHSKSKSSIKTQAIFWYRNVNDFVNQKTACTGQLDYSAFTDLLKRLFSDYESYETNRETNKSLDNYHNLTDTLDFLYYMSVVGSVVQYEGETCLIIDKDVFKSQYKNKASFPLFMLQKHCFLFRYMKLNKEVMDYKNCDRIIVNYKNDDNLIVCLSCFAKKVVNIKIKIDAAYKRFFFYRADFDSVLFPKEDNKMNQGLSTSILNTLGNKKEFWLAIIEMIQLKTNMIITASIHPYVNPCWRIKMNKKSKNVASFILQTNKIRIILTNKSPSNEMRNCNRCGKCIGAGDCQDDIAACQRFISDINNEASVLKYAQIIIDRFQSI